MSVTQHTIDSRMPFNLTQRRSIILSLAALMFFSGCNTSENTKVARHSSSEKEQQDSSVRHGETSQSSKTNDSPKTSDEVNDLNGDSGKQNSQTSARERIKQEQREYSNRSIRLAHMWHPDSEVKLIQVKLKLWSGHSESCLIYRASTVISELRSVGCHSLWPNIRSLSKRFTYASKVELLIKMLKSDNRWLRSQSPHHGRFIVTKDEDTKIRQAIHRLSSQAAIHRQRLRLSDSNYITSKSSPWQGSNL